MPSNKKKSEFLEDLGAAGRKAHEAHKADETTYSEFGDLPPDIKDGIAQLKVVKFDKYKKGDNEGKWFFYAAGIVHEPEDHTYVDILTKKPKTARTKGKRTSIMEPLHETPGRSRETLEEHLEWVYNELRKLGLDTSEMEFEEIETRIKELAEQGPFFSFNTWQGEVSEDFPNPRVNHRWEGLVDAPDGATSEEGGDVADDSAGSETVETETEEAEAVEETEETTEETEESAEETTEEGEAAEESEIPDVDLMALLKLAKRADPPTKDAKAGAEVKKVALAVGIDNDVIEAADSWRDVVGLVEAAITPSEGEEVEESSEAEAEEVAEEPAPKPAPAQKKAAAAPAKTATVAKPAPAAAKTAPSSNGKTPVKGGVWKYGLLDPKTKKRKLIEVEVMSVDPKNKTAMLKNLEDRKSIYKGVKWDALQPT